MNYKDGTEREKIISLTKKDFRVDWYRGEGNGGQKKNKTNSACRITHIASGAVGQAQDSRSSFQNKELAFQRLLATKQFKDWLRIETARKTGVIAKAEEWAEEQMNHIRVEKQVDGKWIFWDEEL